MNKLRVAVGGAVTGVWVVGYLAAFFIDKSLQGLAQSATPVMLVFVGFLFAREGIALIRNKNES